MVGSLIVISPDPGAELLRALAPLRDAPEQTAVLCDVDGTLAPIVPLPEDAALLEGTPGVLAALREKVSLLGFISGRALDSAREIVGMDGVAYAGNHGMEVQRPDGEAGLAPGVARHLPAVAAFADRWPRSRLDAAGVRPENKGATLSFHARGATDPAHARRVLAELEADARAQGLVARPGREVLEVRPGIRIDKGTAVRALLARSPARQAVYFGDDWTDADAWHALLELRREGVLRAAVTVAVLSAEVPDEARARADHLVDGPEGVLAALRYLAGAPDLGTSLKE